MSASEAPPVCIDAGGHVLMSLRHEDCCGGHFSRCPSDPNELNAVLHAARQAWRVSPRHRKHPPKDACRRESNVQERSGGRDGCPIWISRERAAGRVLTGNVCVFEKRVDVICRFAAAVTEGTRMAAERTPILRPALARLPGGSAGIAARRGRLLVARAAPGAHLPRSSWIGPEAPAGARTGAAWSSTPGPEARGCVASAQPWFGRRAPCGQRTERACLQGRIGGGRAFREDAGGGACAARAGAAAPGRETHVKTAGWIDSQAVEARRPRRRLTRDNCCYRESICQIRRFRPATRRPPSPDSAIVNPAGTQFNLLYRQRFLPPGRRTPRRRRHPCPDADRTPAGEFDSR